MLLSDDFLIIYRGKNVELALTLSHVSLGQAKGMRLAWHSILQHHSIQPFGFLRYSASNLVSSYYYE